MTDDYSKPTLTCLGTSPKYVVECWPYVNWWDQLDEPHDSREAAEEAAKHFRERTGRPCRVRVVGGT